MITQEDKRKALMQYIAEANKGLRNEYEASYVRRKGTEAIELQGASMGNAQERVIKQFFDEQINK